MLKVNFGSVKGTQRAIHTLYNYVEYNLSSCNTVESGESMTFQRTYCLHLQGKRVSSACHLFSVEDGGSMFSRTVRLL
jgi:hypothetical protein